MDIKDLKYIYIVVQEESFSKAAKLLFISQPALSQSIKRLEAELGVVLFYRDRSRVLPTEAGILLATKGESLIEALASLDKEVRQFGNPENRVVTIGMSQFYGHYLLAKVLKAFTVYNEGVKLQLVEGESGFLETQIRHGRLDFGFVPIPISTSSLVMMPVAEEDILLGINQDDTESIKLAEESEKKHGVVQLETFMQHPFILLKLELKLRRLVDAICAEHNFLPNSIYETENLDVCQSLVRDNYGIAFLPSTIRDNAEKKGIRLFKINSTLAIRQLVLVSTSEVANMLKLEKVALQIGKEMEN